MHLNILWTPLLDKGLHNEVQVPIPLPELTGHFLSCHWRIGCGLLPSVSMFLNLSIKGDFNVQSCLSSGQRSRITVST